MMDINDFLKRMPVDFAQGRMSKVTKGKKIASSLIKESAGDFALDIGCRDGHHTKWLENKGYLVKSIDIEKVYYGCEIVDANKKLPYRDNTFKVVWCSEVIEHLQDPLFSVNEMRRVLKFGGDLIITTPNSNFWLYHFMKLFGKSARDLQRKDHIHFFHFKDMKRLFPDADLYGFFPYFILKLTIKKMISPLSPTFIIHEVKR